MEQEAKEAFFKELYQLDQDESDEDSVSHVDGILSTSKLPRIGISDASRAVRETFVQSPRLDLAHAQTVSKPLTGPGITPDIRAKLMSSVSLSSVKESCTPRQQAVEQSTKVTQPPSPRNMTKTNKKRKRSPSLEVKPENQQIFKGWSVFFVPNDDVAPARRLRIRRLMEFGALRIKEWGDGITHIIADKDIPYQDILKFLKIDSLPAGVTLVDESFPGDYLRYRSLGFRPDPKNYRVKGHEIEVIAPSSSTSEISSGSPLLLEPGKDEAAPPKQTPSRTESSEQYHVTAVQNTIDAPNYESLGKSSIVSERPSNALDEAIKEAKEIHDLPLDFDEEDVGVSHSADRSDDERSEDEHSSNGNSKNDTVNKSWQEGFACMSKHDGKGNSENPNARTIEILQRMANYYEQTHDHWRLTAYRKAIGALRKQVRKITCAKEAFAVPFIGQRLADKIEEIVWTDRLRRLENTKLEPNDDVIQLFTKIYGVGLKQATKWIDQGYRTISDLFEKAPLTKNQKIGIEHLDDFQTRIPRDEMDRHDQYVRKTCGEIDATIQFTIGGSYRRGAADSGDVDFIVTKPDCPIEVLRTIVLETIIPHLFKIGYLKVGLATTSKEDGSKWHGAATLPGSSIWRRIDFLLVPWEELGSALIYFTGNDIFNRSIRLLASKKGMRLNQRGLWKDVIRGENRVRITQGSLVESKDERKIFELLGVPWRPPYHRCVGS